MEARKKLTATEPATAVEPDPYAPRKLTFAENVILTVKILGALGLVVAMVWGISLWTSSK